MARIATALVYGLICHGLFGIAVGAMIWALHQGMSNGFGRVPAPWSWIANAALLLQFPVGHSILLTRPGQRWLARLAPATHGRTLSTTTYAIIASGQLAALFLLWTPSGVIWWQAQGVGYVATIGLFTASWVLLMKASFDAGAEVQSGLLGWWSLLLNRVPVFPDMPVRGLFRFLRQPIYLAFAMTLWTVPTWTPDQLAVSGVLTLYCLLGPLLKERRFERLFGPRFESYRRSTPYVIPDLRGARSARDPTTKP